MRLLHLQLRFNKLPKMAQIPNLYLREYRSRDCWKFSYVFTLDDDRRNWVRRFAILGSSSTSRRLLVYQDHESDQILAQIALDDHQLRLGLCNDIIDACLGTHIHLNINIAFAIVCQAQPSPQTSHVFLCPTETERNKWVSLIERVKFIPRMMLE